MKKEIPLEKSYGDDHVDDHVDKEIEDCFSTKNPKCFFVFAGAGSGKTRSLINTLNFLDREQGENLLMNGKQVAVITYTNAACDEISRRLQYKTIFSVSTIHSFLWDLIKYYQADIKSWLVESVQKEIEELQRKKTKKTGSKAGEKREEKMPLNDSKKFDTSLRDGSILELSILSKIVSPLVKAYKIGNDFEVAKIVRKNSPLLSKDAFVEEFKDQTELLKNAEEAVETLMQLWNDEKNPTCLEVLESIRNTGLFDVGSRIDELLTDYSQDEDEKITALRTALSVPFYEVERYALYVSDNTRFATHQGVKGLEFPRVMVILDDAQAKGFLFSYEKLFGVKEQSDTDIKNERDGKDTGITRTARLFYVACTRAENSLAIVAYTENEEMVKATALSNGWFLENEIYII